MFEIRSGEESVHIPSTLAAPSTPLNGLPHPVELAVDSFATKGTILRTLSVKT